jgi:transcription elongation factor GreA
MSEFLTKKKLLELQKELQTLKTEGRKAISEDLRTAKELGDLSENSEYIEARERQQRTEKKIAELEQVVRNAIVIGQHARKKGIAEVGSTIKASHHGEHVTFFIVGSSEARPEQGYISNESPLGQALIGHKAGDVVEFKTPKGKSEYRIEDID